jgi:DNA-binding CsgD family transcriptional regulator
VGEDSVAAAGIGYPTRASPSGDPAGIALDRAVDEARKASGLPVVFAGQVIAGSLRITSLRGNRSDALQGLTLSPDVGLGGRALALARPVSVRDYASALAISHEHDSAVAREGLRALVAVPVPVRAEVGAVLYGGLRSAVHLGDAIVSEVIAVGQRLSRNIEARGERRRRIADLMMGASPARASAEESRQELRRLIGELEEVVSTSEDLRLKAEVHDTCDGLLNVMKNAGSSSHPKLSPRELDVLALASVGCTNIEIAEQLGVAVEAVRSYLRSLRRKFAVRSRQAAVCAARSSGVLP